MLAFPTTPGPHGPRDAEIYCKRWGEKLYESVIRNRRDDRRCWGKGGSEDEEESLK